MVYLYILKDRARFEIGKVEECLILAITKFIAIIAITVIAFVMVMIIIIP